MVHGWPDTYRLWDGQVEALKDRYRCVRFTLPGFDAAQPRLRSACSHHATTEAERRCRRRLHLRQPTLQLVQEALRPVSSGLEFSVDNRSGKTIVRVVDLETQQLVRQIPSKEIVEIARVLERLEGLLFKDQA